jgi:hypothetical protein
LTINLLHWVPEGIIMLADSMVTHRIETTSGPVVTNFEHAEKLVCLGRSLPAAAMLSGQAVLVDEFVSVILKKAGLEVESAGVTDAAALVAKVRDAVDVAYRAKVPLLKAAYAAQWSTPESLARINADRKARGLPDNLTVVTPDRVAIKGDPANTNGPDDYDVVFEMQLTVVVASYFGQDPAATEIIWPGPRENDVLAMAGKRLIWWGTGGVPVGRLMNGFDMPRLTQSAGTATDAGVALAFFQREALTFAMPVPMAAMPLQGAIDFAEYMGEVASGYDRFRAGPPTVGGELDILVLTPGTRAWAGHKEIHTKGRRRRRTD